MGLYTNLFLLLRMVSTYFWESNRGTEICYIKEDNMCGTGEAVR